MPLGLSQALKAVKLSSEEQKAADLNADISVAPRKKYQKINSHQWTNVYL